MKLTTYGFLLLTAIFYISFTSASTSNDPLKDIAIAAANVAKNKQLILPVNYTDLLIAEPYGISRIGILDNPNRRMMLRTLFIGGIDYHIGTDRVYWTEISTGRINSRSLDRSGRASYETVTVFEKSPLEWRPKAIAADHIHGKLYVLDSRGKKVHVLALNGADHSVIFDGYLADPLDLAIDPSEGVLFIADGSRIYITQVVRMNLDGTSPKAIVFHYKYYIKSVALDLKHKRIYWSEETYHRLKSANYDGSQYNIVLKNKPGKPFCVLGPANLVFHDSYLYLYDDIYRRVSRIKIDDKQAGKADMDTLEIVYKNVNVRAMKIIHPENK